MFINVYESLWLQGLAYKIFFAARVKHIKVVARAIPKKNIYYRFISQPPIQHPNVDKPKSRYISDLYQL